MHYCLYFSDGVFEKPPPQDRITPRQLFVEVEKSDGGMTEPLTPLEAPPSPGIDEVDGYAFAGELNVSLSLHLFTDLSVLLCAIVSSLLF